MLRPFTDSRCDAKFYSKSRKEKVQKRLARFIEPIEGHHSITDRFRLLRNINNANSSLPIINGTVEGFEHDTVITLSFRMTKTAAIRLVLSLTFCFSVGTLLAVGVLIRDNSFWAFSVPVGFCTAIYFLTRFTFMREVRIAIRDFEKIFEVVEVG